MAIAAVVVSVGPATPPVAGAPVATTTVDDRPNIVLIVTDDQTLENQWVLSFVNERLGGRGTTFTNAIASYPLCCPSRATMLTGQYAHNHGVRGNHWPRGGYLAFDDSDTLATWLQDAGYFTAFAGKYMNEYGGGSETPEVPPGWDDWFAKLGAGRVYYGYNVLHNGEVVSFGHEPADYSTDVYADHVAQVILDRAGEEAPFFIKVSPLAPHGAEGSLAVPAPRHEGAFADAPLPRPPSFNEAVVSDKPEFVRSRALLTDEVITGIEQRYRDRLESLLAVDDLVERVFATLKATGEYEETLLIFTSDNGYFEGQHRVAQGKILPYEPAVRVPLVIAGPGFPRRTRTTVPVANLDIAPTVLAAAGVEPTLEMDGVALQDVVADPASYRSRPLLLEAFGESAGYAGVRTEQWQYVEYDTGERELYDLVRDPDQLVSRHDRASVAAVQADLAAQLAVLRTCSGATCWPPPPGTTGGAASGR